jgi:hypothetical protein
MQDVNSGAKYVMIRLDILGDIQHANFMLIDCVNKQIRIFEPNAGSRVQCLINYIRTSPDWLWLFTEGNDYKWAQVAADICPMGLQSAAPAWGMQKDEYCQTWVPLVSLLYLENIGRDKNTVIKPLLDAGPDAKLILLAFSHAIFRKYSDRPVEPEILNKYMQQCIQNIDVILHYYDTKKDVVPLAELFHLFKHISKPANYLSYVVYKNLILYSIIGLLSALSRDATDDELKVLFANYHTILDKFRLDPLITPLLVVPA